MATRKHKRHVKKRQRCYLTYKILSEHKKLEPLRNAAKLVINGPPVDRGALQFAEIVITHYFGYGNEKERKESVIDFERYREYKRKENKRRGKRKLGRRSRFRSIQR